MSDKRQQQRDWYPDHMVLVRAEFKRGSIEYGSGFAFGGASVLTARHVVQGASAIRVWFKYDVDESGAPQGPGHEASLEWSPTASALDVARLQLSGEQWNLPYPLPWEYAIETGGSWTSGGFPNCWSVDRARKFVDLYGTIESIDSNSLVLGIQSKRGPGVADGESSPSWKGASGAPMLVSGHFAGIVAQCSEGPTGPSFFHIVSYEELLREQGFSMALPWEPDLDAKWQEHAVAAAIKILRGDPVLVTNLANKTDCANTPEAVARCLAALTPPNKVLGPLRGEALDRNLVDRNRRVYHLLLLLGPRSYRDLVVGLRADAAKFMRGEPHIGLLPAASPEAAEIARASLLRRDASFEFIQQLGGGSAKRGFRARARDMVPFFGRDGGDGAEMGMTPQSNMMKLESELRSLYPHPRKGLRAMIRYLKDLYDDSGGTKVPCLLVDRAENALHERVEEFCRKVLHMQVYSLGGVDARHTDQWDVRIRDILDGGAPTNENQEFS